MYSENEKQYSRRRSGDEFLRRMRNEEFLSRLSSGSDIPTFSRSDIPRVDQTPRTGCDGTTRNENGGMSEQTNRYGCSMPSLAMVYSPIQKWQKMLSPEEALSKGSMFVELIKPFEGDNTDGGGCREGGCRK